MLYHAMEGEAQLWTTGDPEPELMNDLDGERVGRARMKEVIEIIRGQMMERSLNWSGVAYPSEGWAHADLRRAGRRAPVGSRRVLHPARRGRPRAGVARPHGAARRTREDAERARPRRDPLHRAGHRPDRRAEPERALDVRVVPDARRDRVRTEHADGRGLHDARLPPRRRERSARAARWCSTATSSRGFS